LIEEKLEKSFLLIQLISLFLVITFYIIISYKKKEIGCKVVFYDEQEIYMICKKDTTLLLENTNINDTINIKIKN
jgi:hypothetical protein